MPKSAPIRNLKSGQVEELLQTLRTRFERHPHRHTNLSWSAVEDRLQSLPGKLWSLHEMEQSGGEPDVVGLEPETGEFLIFDCTPESPKGRRSLCYDREGLESRKEHAPENSAMDRAREMGIEILSVAQYQFLQTLGEFDLKTSSWVLTPPDIRKLGGALFGDRRYGQVFIYHNGAQSYYGVRGFRGCLRV